MRDIAGGRRLAADLVLERRRSLEVAGVDIVVVFPAISSVTVAVVGGSLERERGK